MNKKTRIPIIGICLVLISMAFVNSVSADEDTEISVYVLTEGDVDAFFNATAGGNVSYWIEDIEVKSEFISIWDYINSLKTDISKLDEDVGKANSIATSAFTFAGNNLMLIRGNEEDIAEIFKTLSDMNETIGTLISDINLLHDMIMENNKLIGDLTLFTFNLSEDFKDYKTDTDNKIAGLNSDLSKTQGELAEFKATFYNLGIVAVILGLIVVALYLINRKYPVKHIIVTGKSVILDRQYKRIVDHVKRSNKAKAGSKKTRRIRRNPDKNPVKLMLIHFNILK